MIEFKNISKQFGNQTALQEVSFSINQGEIVGLLGPNGAGKTTLIRLLTQLLLPSIGEVKIDNELLNRKHLLKMGYMPEERGMYKEMKVSEYLFYIGSLYEVEREKLKMNIAKWINIFELKGFYNKEISTLSKGTSQKIQFISTVLHQPTILILDEPFSGLDPISSELLETQIQTLKKQGVTIILSTHRMEQVENYCDSIVLINKGRLVLSGNISEVKNKFDDHKIKIKISKDTDVRYLNKYNPKQNGNSTYIIDLNPNKTLLENIQELCLNNIQIDSYERYLPSINDIFIKSIK